MGGTGKESELPKKDSEKIPEKHSGKDDGKASKPASVEDDIEDGDFVTPKRDRDGDDDQPL